MSNSQKPVLTVVPEPSKGLEPTFDQLVQVIMKMTEVDEEVAVDALENEDIRDQAVRLWKREQINLKLAEQLTARGKKPEKVIASQPQQPAPTAPVDAPAPAPVAVEPSAPVAVPTASSLGVDFAKVAKPRRANPIDIQRAIEKKYGIELPLKWLDKVESITAIRFYLYTHIKRAHIMLSGERKRAQRNEPYIAELQEWCDRVQWIIFATNHILERFFNFKDPSDAPHAISLVREMMAGEIEANEKFSFIMYIPADPEIAQAKRAEAEAKAKAEAEIRSKKAAEGAAKRKERDEMVAELTRSIAAAFEGSPLDAIQKRAERVAKLDGATANDKLIAAAIGKLQSHHTGGTMGQNDFADAQAYALAAGIDSSKLEELYQAKMVELQLKAEQQRVASFANKAPTFKDRRQEAAEAEAARSKKKQGKQNKKGGKGK